MPQKKYLGNNIHYRPLLDITKQEILDWAKLNKLNWITDPLNHNINLDRNFIRNIILPQIEEKWFFFTKNCIRSIKLCNDEQKLLQKLSFNEFSIRYNDNGSLNINHFNKKKENIRNIILRHWLSKHKKKMLSYKNIQNIYDKIICANEKHRPVLQFKTYEIQRYKKRIYILPIKKNIDHLILFWKNLNIPLILPNQLGILKKNIHGIILPLPHNKDLINIRFITDKKINISKQKPMKQIKKIWQTNNIPPWERKQIPLLYYNNNFISALGYTNCYYKKYISKQPYWSISWYNIIKK